MKQDSIVRMERIHGEKEIPAQLLLQIDNLVPNAEFPKHNLFL